MTPTHPTAALYARVSTEEQRERQTINTQTHNLNTWAHQQGIPIAHTYTDDGVTGILPLNQRPAGAQLLKDAQEGKFNLLLVYRIDRLGRDTQLILSTIQTLEHLGIKVKSTTEPFDTADPMGKLMLTMLSGFASFERDSIIERSKAGTRRLAEQGTWLGGIVPYGYRVEGSNRNARLVISDTPIPGHPHTEADIIQRIYNLVGQQQYSCIKVADLLNAEGIPTTYTRDNRTITRGKRTQRTTGRWTPGRIRNMLINTTYKGTHQYGKRSKTQTIIERPVPAIVPEDLWDLAQTSLKQNQINASKNAKHPYLLRSLIKCGHCGFTYIGKRQRNQYYYSCNGRLSARRRGIHPTHKCHARSIQAEHLETQIWSDIEHFIRNPGETINLLHQQSTQQQQSTQDINTQIDNLTRILNQKDEEQTKILQLYRRGLITQDTLERQLNDITTEHEQLKQERENLQRDQQGQATHQHHLQKAQTLLEDLQRNLDQGLSWQQRREITQALVSRITIHTHETEVHVEINYRFAAPLSDTDRGSSPRRV